MSWRNVSIQGPGRGKRLRSAGAIREHDVRRRHAGAERREHQHRDDTGCVSAYRALVPMKGAVHGVAMTVARAPVQNDAA
jgi:hypothetical protein